MSSASNSQEDQGLDYPSHLLPLLLFLQSPHMQVLTLFICGRQHQRPQSLLNPIRGVLAPTSSQCEGSSKATMMVRSGMRQEEELPTFSMGPCMLGAHLTVLPMSHKVAFARVKSEKCPLSTQREHQSCFHSSWMAFTLLPPESQSQLITKDINQFLNPSSVSWST